MSSLNKAYFFSLFLLILTSAMLGQNKLQLDFSPVNAGEGQLFVQVENEDASYHLDTIMKANTAMVSLQLNDLKSGKYLVKVFYDQNSNGKMDTNMFGVPTEKYGFSNNARGTFGPPSKEATLFSVPEIKKMDIQLK